VNLPSMPTSLPLSGVKSPPLPLPGNAGSQLQAAQNLTDNVSSSLSTGNTQNLLGAGITLLQDFGGSSKIAQIATDVLGGASAGYAVGGPYGAVIGTVAATIAAAFTIGHYTGATTQDMTQQVQAIYGRLSKWCAIPPGQGFTSQLPQGWSLADYAAVVQPPKTTRRAQLLLSLLQETAKTLPQIASITNWNMDLLGGPTMLYNVTHGGWTAAQVAADPMPLCTPIWWYFGASDQITNCIRDEWFGWAVPASMSAFASGSSSPPTVGPASKPGTILYSIMGDIVAPSSTARQKILARAIERLPDPLYWTDCLYAQQFTDQTYFYNTALMVGIATVLGMLCTGASTRAICSELLLQWRTLSEAPSGVPAPFQSLLDDYLTMAHYEERGRKFPGWHAVSTGVSKVPAKTHGAASKGAAHASAATMAVLQKYIRLYGGHTHALPHSHVSARRALRGL
jgi:hypothetical protein